MKKWEVIILISILPLCILIGNIRIICDSFQREPMQLLIYPGAYLLTYFTPWFFKFTSTDDGYIRILTRSLLVFFFIGTLGLMAK